MAQYNDWRTETGVITGVKITTSGSDALFIDRVWLMKQAGDTIKTWGFDNKMCVSTDYYDAGAWGGSSVYWLLLHDLFFQFPHGIHICVAVDFWFLAETRQV